MRCLFRRAGVAALCAAGGVLLVAARSLAQAEPGEDRLAGARSLFAEALRDEGAMRFAEALPKFQRVRDVRDTASVEYRIGTCLEGVGQPAQAYAAYREATVLGRDDAQSTDVVAAAIERLRALEKHVARLVLVLSPRAPGDTEVRIDASAVPARAMLEPIPLEPGTHVVTASAKDATPFRSEVVLPEGAQASLSIALEPRPAVEAGAPGSSASSVRTTGWIAVAGGGALAGAAAVLLLARHLDIASLGRACPGGQCPPGANAAELQSTRDRALIEGPAALVSGAVGLVAASAGAWLVLSARDTPSASPPATARLVPVVSWGGGGLALAGVFQ